MATVKIGTRVCNNCVHWQCDKGRYGYDERVFKNNDVWTPANCAECDVSHVWKDATDTCPCFEHMPEKRNPGEAFLRSTLESLGRDPDSWEKKASATTKSVSAADDAEDDSGNRSRVYTSTAECFGCHGTGKRNCRECSGKGGFEIALEIKEKRKCFDKSIGTLLDVHTDGGFWKNCWDWKSDPESVRNFAGTHVVCSKTKEASVADSARKIQENILKVSMVDGDFKLPDGLSEAETEKWVEGHLAVFNTYIEKCKEIEKEAQSWSADSWGDATHRIKSASLEITETPCFVQVEFKDRYGFNRTALVNLASKKAYLNEVSEEERKRRMPELEAEAANNADLQNVIGQMYGNYPKFKGYAPKDVELAAGWFMRAAKAGHADAMDNLGNCYKNGNGVEKDEELAAAWYAKAAKNGLQWGQFHYADVLENGKGVTKDAELAVAWYLKAAKQGLADAQWRLGCRIADGRGTEKDKELGEAWKERAKANGFVPPRSSGW